MSPSEIRYRQIFEHTPVALWEEDFTDVYAAFDALRARGISDFRAYFNAHPAVVGELAAKVRILDMNLHAVQLYEAASKEELLTSIDETFDADTLGVFVDELVALAEGETFFEAEVAARTLRGRRIHILLQLKIIETHAGSVRGLLSILDISYRKQVEKELETKNLDLARSNGDLEQFAYMASHDLQEPLRMISSYAQLLERRLGHAFDEKSTTYMGFISNGAKRLQALVTDLLTLSRVGGTMEGRLKPADLSRVFQEVVQSLEVTIASSDATVTCDRMPVIMADARQLHQLLQNLISNGIKFRGIDAPRIHMSARRHGDEWIIAVADNGIGIEKKFHDVAFSAFRRLHAQSSYPGNGIGLAIAKKIVERQGGRIWVESELGKGATFYFTLKAAD